jgi:hypothetical protein
VSEEVKGTVLCGVCRTRQTVPVNGHRFLEDGELKFACDRCWGLMMPVRIGPGGIKNPLPNARKRAKEEDRKNAKG